MAHQSSVYNASVVKCTVKYSPLREFSNNGQKHSFHHLPPWWWRQELRVEWRQPVREHFADDAHRTIFRTTWVTSEAKLQNITHYTDSKTASSENQYLQKDNTAQLAGFTLKGYEQLTMVKTSVGEHWENLMWQENEEKSVHPKKAALSIAVWRRWLLI